MESFLTRTVAKDCDKMSKHIDFIDHLYETVRAPLNYICGNISHMIGNGTEYRDIPELTNHKSEYM